MLKNVFALKFITYYLWFKRKRNLLKMKNLTLLFAIIAISIFAQASQAQTHLPWKEITTIPGKILAFTHKNNKLYAYAKSGIYVSDDKGTHWQRVGDMPITDNLSVITYNDSIVILMEYNSWYEGYMSYEGGALYLFSGAYTRALGSTYKYYAGSTHGGIAYFGTTNVRLQNDGSLFVVQIGRQYSDYYSYDEGTTDFRLTSNSACAFKNIESHIKKPGVDEKYADENKDIIEQIFAHKGDSLYAICQDSIYTFNTELELLEKYPLPFSTPSFFQYANHQFYVLTVDGGAYTSLDGQSWSGGNTGVTGGIIDYKYHEGLHIVQTGSQTFLSHDFVNFTPILTSGPKPVNFNVNGNFVIATTDNPNVLYRSFDLGETWELFRPQGGSQAKILNVNDVNGHLVAITAEGAYEQVCQDSFIYNTDYQGPVTASTIQLPNGKLVKGDSSVVLVYDSLASQWVNLFDFQEDIKYIGSQENELLVWHGNQLDVLDDSGQIVHSFSNFTAPKANFSYSYSLGMTKVIYSNDTLLANEKIFYQGYPKHIGNNTSYSVDGGNVWNAVIDSNNYNVSGQIFRCGGYFYIGRYGLSLGYNDISKVPIATNKALSYSATIDPKAFSIESSGHSFFMWDDDHFYYSGDQPNDRIFFQRSAHRLWSFSPEGGGLYRTNIEYMDSTILEAVPTTVSSDCALESGYYLASASACSEDRVMDVEKVYIDSTLTISYRCSDGSLSENYDICDFIPRQNFVILGENGACDTSVTVDEKWLWVINDTLLNASICSGDSVVFQGNTYKSGVYYLDTISSVIYGCDSLITMITVHEKSAGIELVEGTVSCAQDVYLYNNQLYPPGFYYNVDTIQDMTGCDSLKINLKVSVGGTVCRPVGKVFYDTNENGIYDWSEEEMDNYPVYFDDLVSPIYTDEYGNYYRYDSDTTKLYSAKIVPWPNWKVTTDSVQYFHPLPAFAQGHDFGIVQLPDAIIEVDHAELVITPNPAHHRISVQLQSKKRIRKVSIMDGLGRLVISSTETLIDVSRLTSGIYWVRVETDGGSWVHRLVVERG